MAYRSVSMSTHAPKPPRVPVPHVKGVIPPLPNLSRYGQGNAAVNRAIHAKSSKYGAGLGLSKVPKF